MKVHRLHIENYKAIRTRDIEIPDSGVVVLHGRNEVGKTSIIEAFDALMRFKDSSRHGDIKNAQPVGQDVPVVVEAEFSIGEVRVRYRKQWLKSPATTLSHLEGPRAGRQVTGGEAHEEVEQLWKGADTQLWDALRLMQADALKQVPLTDSAALRSALDAQAGVGFDDDGASAGLLERVRAEVDTWYSAGRRPNATYKRAESEQAAAAAEARQAAEELAEVTRREDELARVVDELAHYGGLLSSALAERSARHAAADQVRATQEEHERAATALLSAEQRHRDAVNAARARQQQVEDLAEATGEVERLSARLAELEAELAPALERLEQAEEAQARAGAAAAAAQGAFAAATRDRAHLADVERLGNLARTLSAAQELRDRIADFEARPAGTVHAGFVEELEKAAHNVDVTAAELAAGSARLVVEALGEPREALLDGSPLTVAPAEPLARALVRPTAMEIPGQWRISVSPQQGNEDRAAAARAARTRYEDVLARGGVADLTAARRILLEQEDAARELAAARRQRTEIFAGRDESDVRDEHDLLLARTAAHLAARSAGPLPADIAAADALVEAAESAAEEAREALDFANAAEKAARAAVSERNALLHKALGEFQTRNAERERHSEHLRVAREHVGDDCLQAEEREAAGALGAARGEESRLRAVLVGLDAESVLADAQLADDAVAGLNRDLAALKERRSELRGRLEGMGRDQLHARFDRTQTAAAAADRELAALERRARAALRLEEVLKRHQAAAHARYVQPFREKVELLGRATFADPDFGVTVSDSLEITERRLGGKLLPFEAPSTGAKEQLVILIRLATAMLVDPREGVPVMLDDALGHSDRLRLQRVGTAIAEAGRHTQVVLLTANPERYSALVDAVRVPL